MIYYNKSSNRRLSSVDVSGPDFAAIQEKLGSQDPLSRMEAVKQLEALRTPAAVDLLVAYLLKNNGHLDMEDSVNPLVIQLLGWMEDPRAIPALKTAEEDLKAALNGSDDEDVFGYRDAFSDALELARASISMLSR